MLNGRFKQRRSYPSVGFLRDSSHVFGCAGWSAHTYRIQRSLRAVRWWPARKFFQKVNVNSDGLRADAVNDGRGVFFNVR